MLDFALVVPDCHVNYEHPTFELMLRVCSHLRIKIVVLLGDFLDCFSLSFHDKDPNLGTPKELWLRERECARIRLNQLERLGAGYHVFLEGNHENRLTRSLKKFTPALDGRISVPHEIELDRNVSWKWVNYDAYQKYQIPGTQIYCTHKPPAGGQALNVAKQAGATIVYGHTHQVQDATFINKITGDKVRAINLGWLGDESQSVFQYVQNRPNWALAFGLASHLGTFHIVNIEKDSNGYYCVFGDKEYR